MAGQVPRYLKRTYSTALLSISSTSTTPKTACSTVSTVNAYTAVQINCSGLSHFGAHFWSFIFSLLFGPYLHMNRSSNLDNDPIARSGYECAWSRIQDLSLRHCCFSCWTPLTQQRHTACMPPENICQKRCWQPVPEPS